MDKGSGPAKEERIIIGYSWCVLALAFAVLIVGFLVGPRVPYGRQAEFCVVNVHLAGPFGISLNCDSPEFMRLARDPSALLEPQNTRQSRPGMIFAAAALALPFSPLANLAEKMGLSASRPDIDPARIENALAKDVPAYAAYITLNIAIVLLSFWMFQLICGRPAPNLASAAVFASLSFMLAANDVVKAFMWSPHTQMFNILVPVFAVWGSVRATEGALSDSRFAFVVGLIGGIGATAYPLFVIVVPCVFACGLIDLIGRRSLAHLWAFGVNIALLAILTIAPEALWYAFVRYKAGGFYQHEIAQGQVVWLADAWKQGPGQLVDIWLRHLTDLLQLAGTQAGAIAAFALVFAAVLILVWNGDAAIVRRQWRISMSAAVVAVVIAAFYATTGLVVWRLAYALLPPIVTALGTALVAISSILPARQRAALACCCVAIAAGQMIFEIVKFSPFS